MLNKNIKILIGGLLMISIIFLYGITIYSHSPNLPSGSSLEAPSTTHILGTDDLGIDIFAQISSGFYKSLGIGFAAAIFSFIIGSSLGVVSGYSGGIVDGGILFLIDLFLSIPQLPIMVVIGAFFGQSYWNIIIIITMFSWAQIAKVVRAQTIGIKERGYVKLAKSYGANSFYILKTHMALELVPLMVVNALAVIGKAILQESSLAYLGLSDPFSKSWGLMISKCVAFNGIYFTPYWKWWLIPPVISLLITLICIRLLSRELEELLLKIK